MPKLRRRILGLTLVLSAAASQATADIYNASATGFASDTSDPLDGVGDAAGTKANPIEMLLNASDADSGALVDRRAAFETDLTALLAQLPVSAAIEFEVFTYNTEHPVSIYLYAGDGLITAADYGRTDELVFSGVLDDPTPAIDVTSQVRALLEGGNAWIGVLIGLTNEDQTLAIYNTGYGGTDPRLNTKVPEPGMLALTGILALLAISRRRPA